MSAAPAKDERERAADRITMDYPVPILRMPDERAEAKKTRHRWAV